MGMVLTDENKGALNRFADGVGARFGKHQVCLLTLLSLV